MVPWGSKMGSVNLDLMSFGDTQSNNAILPIVRLPGLHIYCHPDLHLSIRFPQWMGKGWGGGGGVFHLMPILVVNPQNHSIHMRNMAHGGSFEVSYLNFSFILADIGALPCQFSTVLTFSSFRFRHSDSRIFATTLRRDNVSRGVLRSDPR